MAALSDRVLVLNSSWMAVHVATVRRAVSLVYTGLAEVVSTEGDYATYDFDDWKELSKAYQRNDCIETVTFRFRVPEVIRLRFFGRVITKRVRFNRRNIFLRDQNTCQYCGRRVDPGELTLDHVVPRSRGGVSSWENIVLACVECNDRKANRLPSEVSMGLIRPPKRPEWATQIGVRLGRNRKPSWERFVSDAYWNIELKA